MFTKIVTQIAAFLCLWCVFAKAQQTDSARSGCGVSASYILSKGIAPNSSASTLSGTVSPGSFPSSATEVCGPFTFYYEDLRIASTAGLAGFADGVNGLTRRTTFCAVVAYLESVFDFSLIPPGGIRIYVDTSFSPTIKPIAGYGTFLSSDFGAGSFYYDASVTSGLVNGYVHDYIVTGVDLNPGDYHGIIQWNFDKTAGFPGSFIAGRSSGDWLSWDAILNNGLAPTANCQADLFTRLLHTMGHVLGFAGFHDGLGLSHSLPYSPTIYTSLEMSAMKSADLKTNPPLTLSSYWPSFLGSILLANNAHYPDNYFLFQDLCHFSDFEYDMKLRVSPGDYHRPAMCVGWDWGIDRRTFNKADLLTFRNAIGLPFNPLTFSSSSPSAALINNHVPYSDRMASMGYSAIYDHEGVSEQLPVDYSMVNDIGTSLTIDLTTLTADLHDADGDPITIMDGSLVNLRGCGSGGNNHNLLSVNAAKNIITYTPRDDFYGKAQFGFNLWDGHEKGAYVIFTIDVAKGTRVSIPAGDNIVLNGDFEEGSEVRLLSNSVDNYTGGYRIDHADRLHGGQHFADSHPYDCYTNGIYGNAIRGSFQECQTVNSGFGTPFNSFPWTGGAIALGRPGAPGKPDFYPDSKTPDLLQNDRYLILSGFGSLLYLGSELQQCHVYKLEFDIRHIYSPTEFLYMDPLPITVGFTNDNHLIDPATIDPAKPKLSLLTYNQMLPTHYATGVINSAWTHETIYFTYCADSPSNLLYFNITSDQSPAGMEFIDNISIKEMPSIPTTVVITETRDTNCVSILTAGDIINGCTTQTYSWNVKGNPTVLATTKEYTFPTPFIPTTYQVTVSDGCHIVTGEYTVYPCKCAPGDVFKTAAVTVLSGTISGSYASGYYYVSNDILISSATSFTGAKMLMAPGVNIKVQSNASLTLDSCHLFTCPDSNQMWKGITLADGISNSGRISIINNTLIEDADTAVSANNPKVPSSGDIITINNAIFNRNRVGVVINNIGSTSISTYPFTFKNSVFTSRIFDNTSMPGYPVIWHSAGALRSKVNNGAAAPFNLVKNFTEANLKNGMYAYAGILLNRIGEIPGSGSSYKEIVIGDGVDTTRTNMFDFLGYGIKATYANLTLYNNIFTRIGRKDASGSITGGGTAVSVATDYPSATMMKSRLQLLLASTPATTNKFYDCTYGVVAGEIWEVKADGVYMTSSRVYGSEAPGGITHSDGVGMSIRGQNYKNINITNNQLYNLYNGIQVMTRSAFSTFTGGIINVSANTLRGRNPELDWSISAGQFMNKAISLSNTIGSCASCGTTIGNVTIQNNTIDSVFNGIDVKNFKVQRTSAIGNYVRLVKDPAGISQAGIYYAGTTSNTIYVNTVTSATPSVANDDKVSSYYSVNNSNLYLSGNASEHTGTGFSFVGTQPGTSWYCNTMLDNMSGYALDGIIGQQGGFPTAGTIDNEWLGVGTWLPPKAQTTVLNGCLAANSRLYVRTPLLYRPASHNTKGSPSSLPYANGSTVLDRTGIIISPCNTQQKPTTGGKPGSVLLAIAAGTLSFDDHPEVNSWIAQYMLFNALKSDTSLVDSSAELSAFLNAADGSTSFSWLTDIETALTNDDTIIAESLLNSPISPSGVIQVNNDVLITDYQDADYVIQNFVDLYTQCLNLVKGEYVDVSIVESIADLCPKYNGPVVFQARALRMMLTGYNETYDDEQCNNSNRNKSGTAADGIVQRYELYPNPNDGNFVVKEMKASTEPVEARIYNTLGICVYSETLHFDSRTARIGISNIPPGVYLLQLKDKEGNHTIKFNIQ